jgi:hypothetical protein
MDKMFSKLTERLSTPSSRGGFLSTLAKVTVGSGVVLAGGIGALTTGQGPDVAEANGLACCLGTKGTPCNSSSCPPNTNATWVSFCCGGGSQNYRYDCYDCYSVPSGDYICSVGVQGGPNCPQMPAP